MPGPVLPIEIVLWIIDQLLDIQIRWRSTVKKCAVVCRAWVPHCQALLFRELQVGPCKKPGETYRRYRARFETASHLRNYVQEVWINETYEVDASVQPEYPLFLAILAPHLPSLHTLRVMWWPETMCNPRHRIFCAPPFTTPAITSLEISDIHVVDSTDSSNLYEMLLLFPNLQTLELDGVSWPTPPKRPDGSFRSSSLLPAPKRVASLPPITHLSLAMETRVTIKMRGIEESRIQVVGLRSLLNVIGGKLTYFKLNLGAFNHFTRPELNLGLPDTSIYNLPNLQKLDLYLRGPRLTESAEPFTARVARIPKFFWALSAKELRVITIHFSAFEIAERETLEELAVLNPAFEELVQLMHFPLLEKIRLDVASTYAARNRASQRIAEGFPGLSDNGLIEHLYAYLVESDIGSFTDHVRNDIPLTDFEMQHTH